MTGNGTRTSQSLANECPRDPPCKFDGTRVTRGVVLKSQRRTDFCVIIFKLALISFGWMDVSFDLHMGLNTNCKYQVKQSMSQMI